MNAQPPDRAAGIAGTADDFAATRRRAAALGYGLQAVLPAATVPAAGPFAALWLVCNTGDAVQRRWRADRDVATLLAENAENAAVGPQSCGPLDDFCRAELIDLLGARPHRVLFPHPPREPLLPLLPILAAAGWLRPGPFMNTLHARYGSWWAVRALIALDAAVDAPPQALGASPCVTCAAPCLRACPAGAVAPAGWDALRCAEARCRPDAVCAARCPARDACPAGSDWRYDEATVAYHCGVSLASVRQWLAQVPAAAPSD